MGEPVIDSEASKLDTPLVLPCFEFPTLFLVLAGSGDYGKRKRNCAATLQAKKIVVVRFCILKIKVTTKKGQILAFSDGLSNPNWPETSQPDQNLAP